MIQPVKTLISQKRGRIISHLFYAGYFISLIGLYSLLNNVVNTPSERKFPGAHWLIHLVFLILILLPSLLYLINKNATDMISLAKFAGYLLMGTIMVNIVPMIYVDTFDPIFVLYTIVYWMMTIVCFFVFIRKILICRKRYSHEFVETIMQNGLVFLFVCCGLRLLLIAN